MPSESASVLGASGPDPFGMTKPARSGRPEVSDIPIVRTEKEWFVPVEGGEG